MKNPSLLIALAASGCGIWISAPDHELRKEQLSGDTDTDLIVPPL